MALEESSLPSEPLTFDAPEADSGTSAEHVSYSVDTTHFPKPIPIFGPLFGFNNKRYERILTQQCKSIMSSLQRPPNQDETNAIAYLAAKQMKIMSYGVSGGFVAGMWRAYDTRASWKYPFWKMGPNFNPSSVTIPGGLEILRGGAARAFHQIARTSFYGSNGVILGFLMAIPYSASVFAVGIMQDPRLKNLVEANRGKFEERVKKNVGRTEKSVEATNLTVSESRQNDFEDRDEIKDDDASPTGGQSLEGYKYTNYSGQPSNTYTKDSTPQAPAYSPRQPSWSRTAQKPKRENDSPGSFFGDDDASPTSSTDSQSTSTTSGSAWDRVRQNASSSSRSNYGGERFRGQQGRESSGADNYSFSSAEEEKQLAKDEAQKDFDARLERERQGGDFGGGGGGRRNW